MPDWNKVSVRRIEDGTQGPESLVRSVAHICFTAADLEASIHFYRDILGLTPTFEFLDEHNNRFGIYFHAGERTFIELFSGTHETGITPSFRHLCLEMKDIAAAIKTIEARGGVIDRAVSTGKDGSQQAWMKDPDGNLIELFCYTDASMQRHWLK
ncbi:MAG: VOC family protein [Spirochaetes bacterium]|nr:VOC family protein [Spirochaetota bacterium]